MTNTNQTEIIPPSIGDNDRIEFDPSIPYQYSVWREHSDTLVIYFNSRANYISSGRREHTLFEFSKIYIEKHKTTDFIFFHDFPCFTWYVNGLPHIQGGMDGMIKYLNTVAGKKRYKKVITHGWSMGAYGAILYGSLCKNITHVVAARHTVITPRCRIKPSVPEFKKEHYLAYVMNKDTKYILVADFSRDIKEFFEKDPLHASIQVLRMVNHNLSFCLNNMDIYISTNPISMLSPTLANTINDRSISEIKSLTKMSYKELRILLKYNREFIVDINKEELKDHPELLMSMACKNSDICGNYYTTVPHLVYNSVEKSYYCCRACYSHNGKYHGHLCKHDKINT